MPKSNSHRQSDFKIHEDSICVNDMVEDRDIQNLSRDEIVISEGKETDEALSRSKDSQRDTEERFEMGESEFEIGGDSLLDQELSDLQEDDSILEERRTKHNRHDDCEDCKHAREEKRKRAEARELQMQKMEAEIEASARKLVGMESIEKSNPERRKAANYHNDSIPSMQTDESYESEDHDGSLLSSKTDESYEHKSYNGQKETKLTYDTRKAKLEDDGQTEDEDSILHREISSTDAETEREDAGGEDVVGGDGSSHARDLKEDVCSNHSEKSTRLSMDSADEEPNRMSLSNRSSWESNRKLDLSKEAQQLIELNSPVVGEEAATESVMSRIPSNGSHASAPRARDSLCSPRKIQRHPFRTPSDIRAMQMYSPAPSLFSTPQSSKRQHLTVSRVGTPNGSQHSKSRTPTRFKKNREESPLVLLHVTVLPLRWQYSKAIVAPELPANLYNIREAYYLLQEKLSDTILTRGILLPHPQDSYECLQERFLDALELPFRPRAKILRCGHYMGPNTNSSDEDSADEGDSGFGSNGRFKNRPDKVWCDICHRDVRYEDDDQDEDDKRFNIKIFASNGLMRAGAWAAAWREMERVDVEIEPFVQPWMVEDMEDLIERLREAEERGRDDSFGQYSDDSDRESLGSEAQRLHEEEMAKVTLRQKTVDAESRNAREQWLATASRAAEEEALRISREVEALRLKEEQTARAKEEEAKRLEEEAEALRIHEEAEAAQKAEEEAERLRLEERIRRIQEEEAERLRIDVEFEATRLAEEAVKAQKLADLEADSSNADGEDLQTAKELEAEAQKLREEEIAANQALEEEAQRIHEAELAEQKSIEEEAQRIYDADLAGEKAFEQETKKILEKEEASRNSREDQDVKCQLREQEKSAEEARLKDIHNQASTRNTSSPYSRPRTTPGDESLTELLAKVAGVAMRDRKNILIVVLSVVIIFLALKPSEEASMPKYAPDIIIQNHRYEAGNQGVDQRGHEALRQAVVDGILPMRKIESSMGWKRQEIVVKSSMKAQEPAVVQPEIVVEAKQKRVIMEIEAPDAISFVGEKIDEVAQTTTSEAAETFEVDADIVPIPDSDLEVEGAIAKNNPILDFPSNPAFKDLPLSEPQSQN